MTLERTEELVKALALDFLRNNRSQFNSGVMEALCEQQKVHESTTEKQMLQKLMLIDKAFYLLKHQPISQKQQHNKKPPHTHTKHLHHMLSVLLFNISAINEHYIQQIQSHMMESTASMSYDKNTMAMTMQKDKLATNMLRQRVKEYFESFMGNSKYLHELIVGELMQREQRKLQEGELALLQTVDYLCVKYAISNQISQHIIYILQHYDPHPNQQLSISQLHNLQSIRHINQLIFGQSKHQHNDLFNLLQTSSQISYRHLLMLINCNYVQRSSGRRKIFTNAVRDGKEVVEGLMVRMIKRVGKAELFSEKSQDYGPFKVILTHCLTKHFQSFWQFSHIIADQLNSPNNTSNHHITLTVNTIKRIQQFFRVQLTVGQPFFQQLIGFTYRVLESKYGGQVAVELVKKLLLNRFLLNPAFFILFHDPNEEQIQNFISLANMIRALFYPTKAQQLASSLNNPTIIKLSADILHALQYCLSKQKDPKLLSTFNSNTHSLYINDKIIKSTMLELYNDITVSNKIVTPKSRLGNNLTANNNDYSLEFEFVRNENSSLKNIFSKPLIEGVSEVRLAGNTNRTNNPRDNQSIRYMYDQLKGEGMTEREEEIRAYKKQQKQLNTNLSYTQHHTPISKPALSSQTRLHYQPQSYTYLTDHQMIQQLVQLRKEYGQRKKQIAALYQIRRTKSTRRMSMLQSFSSKFNEFRSEIEKDNDSLYVHMTTIA